MTSDAKTEIFNDPTLKNTLEGVGLVPLSSLQMVPFGVLQKATVTVKPVLDGSETDLTKAPSHYMGDLPGNGRTDTGGAPPSSAGANELVRRWKLPTLEELETSNSKHDEPGPAPAFKSQKPEQPAHNGPAFRTR